MFKIQTLKAFVSKNAPWLVAGTAIGVSIVVITHYESKTTLEINKAHVERLVNHGGFYNYRAFGEDLVLLTKNQLREAVK